MPEKNAIYLLHSCNAAFDHPPSLHQTESYTGEVQYHPTTLQNKHFTMSNHLWTKGSYVVNQYSPCYFLLSGVHKTPKSPSVLSPQPLSWDTNILGWNKILLVTQ